MLFACNISKKSSDLSVIDFSESTGPLPCDTGGLFFIFFEAAGTENEDAIFFAIEFGDVLGDGVENDFVIPVGFVNESLEGTPRLSEAIGDGLDIFSFEIGDVSLNVHGGIFSRFGTCPVLEKGDQKLVESPSDTGEVFLVYFCVVFDFAFSGLKSLFHKDFREKEKRIIHKNRQFRKDQLQNVNDTVQLL